LYQHLLKIARAESIRCDTPDSAPLRKAFAAWLSACGDGKVDRASERQTVVSPISSQVPVVCDRVRCHCGSHSVSNVTSSRSNRRQSALQSAQISVCAGFGAEN
jgi:hypothetical protein